MSYKKTAAAVVATAAITAGSIAAYFTLNSEDNTAQATPKDPQIQIENGLPKTPKNPSIPSNPATPSVPSIDEAHQAGTNAHLHLHPAHPQ